MDILNPDIVKFVDECKKAADGQQSDWRDEARTCYAMVAGEQWEPSDKKSLEDNGRPAVVFNRMGTIIDAVSGSEVNNRQEVKYIPRQIGAVAANELLTSAAVWVRDNCDAEDEESDAFVDVLISGLGWTETRMEYETDPEGKCVIERVDPLQMRWDPAARKRNLADRKWQQRERRFSKEELEARWPDKADEVINGVGESGVTEDDTVNPHEDSHADQYASGKTPAPDRGRGYPVIHHQWFETVSIYQVLSPTSGQIVQLEEDRFQVAQKVAQESGIRLQSVKTQKRIYKQAFVSGSVELESGLAPCQHDFTFQPITGRRDRNKGIWYGLARPMVDPQKWANKFFSQMLHIINTNSKGGVMIEAGATANIRKFEEKWSKADAVIELNAGGSQKVQPKPIAPYPQAIGDMMNFAISSIRDTSGVSLELLGMADRDQNNYIESARTKAGLTILAGFFDALRLYRKKQGRVLAYFITEYMSDGRLIKIVGKDVEQYVPLLKQPDNITYDVIVDSAPTARDMKERTFMTLRELAPMIQQSGLAIPKELVDYMPLPTGLIDAWKREMSQPRPSPQQVAIETEQQMSQIRINEENAKQQAQAQAKIMVEQETAGIQSGKAQTELAQAQIKHATDTQISREEQAAQYESRLMELRAEAEAKQIELAAEYEFKVKEMQAQFAQERELKMMDVAGSILQAQISAQARPAEGEQGDPQEQLGQTTELLKSMMQVLMAPKRTRILRDANGTVTGSETVQ